jgi:nucleoside-diphosphate-sugar epimerase
MRDKKSILVIGANSFIGKNLINFLIESDCYVVGTSRKITTLQNSFYKHILWDAAGDINLVTKRKIDSIILLSTVADINNNTDSEIIENNLKIQRNVLNYISKNPVESCIFTSSMAVYEKKSNYTRIDDNTLPTNKSAYAVSKLQMEKNLSENILTHVIRLPSVLGKSAPHGFLPKVVSALRSNSTITIYNSESLFNHVTETNVVNKLILGLLEVEKQFKSFNISSFHDLTIFQIITRLKKHLSSKSEIISEKSNVTSSLIYSTVWEELQIIQPTVSQVLDNYLREMY